MVEVSQEMACELEKKLSESNLGAVCTLEYRFEYQISKLKLTFYQSS